MIIVFYRVNTSNPDGSITTICSPDLNMIAEVKDTGSVNSDGDHEAEYNVKIVPEYNGKVNSIIDITNSEKESNRAYKQILTVAYSDKIMSINCDYKWFLKRFSGALIKGKSFPLYLIIDGESVSIQTYDYFWDADSKFQKVFRDNMGGNHQWELHWCNMGGRSGVADIIEVSTNAATTPILSYLWKAGGSPGDTYKGLYNFIKSNCQTNSLPEFSKRNDYIKERVVHHMDNDLDQKEAFDSAVQDVRSLTKRKDPLVWEQEYENMGFDHPRPDYLDPKWKL